MGSERAKRAFMKRVERYGEYTDGDAYQYGRKGSKDKAQRLENEARESFDEYKKAVKVQVAGAIRAQAIVNAVQLEVAGYSRGINPDRLKERMREAERDPEAYAPHVESRDYKEELA